ncbi:MAG: hypothetical protein J6V74_04165 [Bacteroidales bacterium]|nr:hypothetical protein [Bacteroidales bacterium]
MNGKKRYFIFKLLVCIGMICLFSQCTVIKNLSNSQQLLVKHKISTDEKKVDKNEMLNYVKPKPNRRFLGFYTRLYFYYAFENSEGKFGSWMRDIVGEQPALYDELSIKKNEEQLRLFMNEQG